MGIARVEGEIRGDANQEEELRYMLESIRSSHTQKELQYQFQKVVKQAMVWNEETEEYYGKRDRAQCHCLYP